MAGACAAHALFVLAVASPVLVRGSCYWQQADEDNFRQKLLIGTIVRSLALILAALPVCCGVLKDKPWLKTRGVALGLVGGLACAIPLITGSVAGSAAVDDMCTRCAGACSDVDRENAKAAVAALGAFVAYKTALGIVVVNLGIVAMGMSCCMCCPCCGLFVAYKEEQGGATSGDKPVGSGNP